MIKDAKEQRPKIKEINEGLRYCATNKLITYCHSGALFDL